jgi:hypothetical protein
MPELTWEFSVIDGAVIAGVIIVIVLFLVARSLAKRSPDSNVDLRFVREQWKKIEQLMQFAGEMNLKLAIIEADKLLDYVLKNMFFPGETMANRLKMATYKFKSLKSVWWAHKVRNHVVHDAKYALSGGESKKVISLFKKALKTLKAL